MDVEFVTDEDTERALLDSFARRRREIVPGSWFVGGVGLFVLFDLRELWDGASRRTVAFVAAMVLLAAAIAVATVARDADRTPVARFPQAEMLSAGLVVASLIVTFEHRATILAFVALFAGLTAWAALLVRCGYRYRFLRDVLPLTAHAVHVHADGDGIAYLVRPHTKPRTIRWRSVRSIEGDVDMLFVGARSKTFVIPRRAFPVEARWREFVEYVRSCAAEQLMSKERSPIRRYVGSLQARLSPVAARPFESRHHARGARGRASRTSGRR